MDLFAMAAAIARAEGMRRRGHPDAARARQLTEVFCRSRARRVRGLFRALWSNDDDLAYRVGQDVLEGRHRWLEAGSLGLGFDEEQLRPVWASKAERHVEPETARGAEDGTEAPDREVAAAATGH